MYHAAETLGGAAAMQRVADWLQKLGLGQYAQSFAENDIDFAVLSDLTDQDLENAAGATEQRAWHSHGTDMVECSYSVRLFLQRIVPILRVLLA
jgi:hypothetical protein